MKKSPHARAQRFHVRVPRQLVQTAFFAVFGFLFQPAVANDWVYGVVSSLEDYGAFDSTMQVLVDLSEKSWVTAADASQCTQRFRIVVNVQGVTQVQQQRFFALLLAAQASGSRVRLFYSTTGAPFCHVQIASIGDF